MIFPIINTKANWKGMYLPLVATADTIAGAAATIGDGTVMVTPVDGHLDIITVTGDANTSGAGETFTLYANGSPTILTITVPSGSATMTVSNITFTIHAGDELSWLYVGTSAGIFTNVALSVRFIPA